MIWDDAELTFEVDIVAPSEHLAKDAALVWLVKALQGKVEPKAMELEVQPSDKKLPIEGMVKKKFKINKVTNVDLDRFPGD